MSTASITTRARMFIQDIGQPFVQQIVCDGVSQFYDLNAVCISATANPPTVSLDGTVIVNGATPTYTFDYKHGVIQFTTVPNAGQILKVSGTEYEYFDDDEVAQAIQDAFNQHVQDQDPLPVIDPGLGQTGISMTEEYLVALWSARELLWFRSTDASSEIDIHTPEGVSIPRQERYQQITRQIAALEDEYKKLSLALGVGIFRLQVLFQRRVSYTTNRLVPLYKEQEYNQPYAGFVPTAAPVGASVTITGQYFTGATAVTFGGVAATTFTINSDTQITAVVPTGAVTGQIGVTTPYGTVLSTAQFVVGQPAPAILYGPDLVSPPIPPGV